MKVVPYDSTHSIEAITKLYNTSRQDDIVTEKYVSGVLRDNPATYLLLTGSKIVGFVLGRVIDTGSNEHTSRHIVARKTLYISGIVSTRSGGSEILITKLLKYKLDMFLICGTEELMAKYRELGFLRAFGGRGDDTIKMIRYVHSRDINLHNPSKVLYMKGNALYELSVSVRNEFISTIEDIVKRYYVEMTILESGIHQDHYGASSKIGDVVIGHSRGASYAEIWKKYYSSEAYFIAINAPDYKSNDLSIANRDDKTSRGVYSAKSLLAHWSLTDRMIDKLDMKLRELSQA